jgi:hypothetical protein
VRIHAAHERLDDTRPSAPGDVEARHAAPAPFGPLHQREPAHALRVQPWPHLPGGEVDVSLGPLARPGIVVPVEAGVRKPVPDREVRRIPDAKAPLLWAVHEEESAERPERLAAERCFRLLFENDDAPAGVSCLRRGDETREARAHDDDIRVHRR